jgi:hypothetical protein
LDAILVRKPDVFPMNEHTRTFQFFEKVEQGNPIKGTCSACNRLFVSDFRPGDRADEVLLRMRADFEGHDCHEETRQMTARIVKGTKERV